MRFALFIFICLKSLIAFTQFSKDSIINRIVLIGGVQYGSPPPQALFKAIREKVPLNQKTALLFLGDNDIYQVKAIAAMIKKSDASAVFIPGEKEWSGGGKAGLDSVILMQSYIENVGCKNISFLPKDGCPGPEEIKLSDDVVLIVLNTQWWLHQYQKPDIESGCPTKSKRQVYDELGSILRKNYNKLVLIAAHHPLKSNGIHGGSYDLKQHLFPLTDLSPGLYLPLPLAGSIYPIIRNAFPNVQDLMNATYESMINDLKKTLSVHPNIVYISGHEENLQLLKDKTLTYIVSGSASKTSRVSRRRESLFTSPSKGFAVIEVDNKQKAKFCFYEIKGEQATLVFQQHIHDFSKLPALKDTTTKWMPLVQDNIKVAASLQYSKPTKLQKQLIGENYRKEWETPILLPLFDIGKVNGGLTIKKLGGGKQSKSLHLEDANGRGYKLRTVDKDPVEFLPVSLRSGLTKRLVKDYMSAQHPYGALVNAAIAQYTGVTEAQPQYFFVPNDTAFGFYRPLFANKVVMLVEKDPYPYKDTKGSYDILNSITEKADHVVNQQSVLRARLLDILTGDFDRHLEQWTWGWKDTGNGKLFEPVPNDRDAAYFNSDGLLVRMLARKNLSLFRGFTKDLSNAVGLGFSADEFDHTFLNTLDEEQWKQVINKFQNDLTDQAIEKSVQQLPPEIYAIRGEDLEEKLKSRRNVLKERALELYRAISEQVNILGSNQNDYFQVAQKNHILQIKVYERKKGDTTMLTYYRSFDPSITREIRLYGLNGNDYFMVDSSVQKSIPLRIVGGGGQDTFVVNGTGKNFIYDRSSEANILSRGRSTRNRMSNHPTINEYKLNSYTYQDKGQFPVFSLAANSEYGLQIGIGANKKTYDFRREPFASETSVSIHYAPSQNSYGIKLSNILNGWRFATGLLTTGEIQKNAIQNFYGIGNETKKDKNKAFSYYRIKYNYAAVDLLVTKNYFDQFNFSFGPSAYYYWNNSKENSKWLAESPDYIGMDSSSMYETKLYIGGRVLLNVNHMDNLLFPTQGLSWKNEFTCYRNMQKNNSPIYARLQSHILLASPLIDTSRLVTLIKVGGGHIFSEQYDFYQALGLGTENNLRGFRNYRFTGNSLLYSSMELRYKAASLHSFLLSGDFGLLGFGDIGRVWTKHTSSQLWHTAYGAGIYLFPYQKFFLSASIGKNEDGAIYNFTIGKTINWYQ
ncbi:metallophosphoesterase [Chitinophagaceae bacterium LB-8]|uniref:Metallophosphoesterase n=1 Tax=Paraflavisolibacter caeni TaxID=2982496 RepID=A0A9X2XXQ8_9BACT|nr:metallophosphoesterase [Paraflavisolibacter caeni]MCU7550502.1 metallophosphoesterase [Paraflavisolibacter caeni]